MDTPKRGATTEMQVTSIRLEPELKERLRKMSGEHGYQSLIRTVLWQFVEQQTIPHEMRSPLDRSTRFSAQESSSTPSHTNRLSKTDIRVTFQAIAQQEERCAITGELIYPQQTMWLGLTTAGELVPLCTGIFAGRHPA